MSGIEKIPGTRGQIATERIKEDGLPVVGFLPSRDTYRRVYEGSNNHAGGDAGGDINRRGGANVFPKSFPVRNFESVSVDPAQAPGRPGDGRRGWESAGGWVPAFHACLNTGLLLPRKRPT